MYKGKQYSEVATELENWPEAVEENVYLLEEHQRKIDGFSTFMKRRIETVTGYVAENVDVEGVPILAFFTIDGTIKEAIIGDDESAWKYTIRRTLYTPEYLNAFGGEE